MMNIGRIIIGGIIGGVAGYGIYKLIGCSTGVCPITGNPFISTIYGVVMGVLVSWR